MCSYLTSKEPMDGSGKGATGWFRLTAAMACYDHPYHSPEEHMLNIDFLNEEAGPSARIAVELTAESARRLVKMIESALESASELLGPLP
jgi:hypothetical protein